MAQSTDTEGMTNAQMPEDRGWYPDPFQAGELLRLFDGARWTEKTRPIPDDYDAKKANMDSKAPASEKQKKQSAPAQPKPPQFSKPPETKAQPKEKAPAPAPASHPKNGTAPMFKDPTAKAMREDETKAPEKKSAQPKAAAPTPPAFATPTAKAMRDDEAEKKPAEPETPTLDPKKKFQFSKPAPGAETPQAEPPAQKHAQQPAKPKFAPPPAPTPTPAGPPGAASVDDDFAENSNTVNAAFASAAPESAAFGDADVSDSSVPARKSRSKSSWLQSIPAPDFVKDTGMQLAVVKWLAAVVLVVVSIAAPTLGPESTKSVASDCLPISKVVAAYDGAEDYTVDSDAQADLAAAVSTGQLNAEVTDLVTTAVETNNLESVVKHCLPQE